MALHADTSGIPSGLKCSLNFNPIRVNWREKTRQRGFPAKRGGGGHKRQWFNTAQEETCFIAFMSFLNRFSAGKSAECFDNRVAQIQADTFSLVEAKGVPMKRFRLGNRDKGSRESQDSHFLLQYRVGGTSESEVRRVRDLETGRVGGEEGAGKKSLEDG